MSAINRLNNGGSIRINNQALHTRQTPSNNFGSQVQRGIANGLGAASRVAGVAAPYVPGGAIVAATMNQAAGAVGDYGTGGTMNTPGQSPGLSTKTGGSSTQSLMDQTKAMQEMQMSFNLQYLNLQNKMQNENRQFSTISNVLKTKHDTAKNAINNVR
jgi:hypothetical protein